MSTGGDVQTELAALLSLQDEDDAVDAVRSRLDELEPRSSALERAREQAARALEESRRDVEADEKRHRELEGRIQEHRQRHERNLAHLDSVKKMREATAAMMQVESGRKILLEEENELGTLTRRIAEGHRIFNERKNALEELELTQAEEREKLQAERSVLDSELAVAQRKRDETAARVSRTFLSKYDRIRARRRSHAVFAVSGMACSCCDTAIPVQRRNLMSTSGSIEICETCGVILYASE
jgi:uncharacterized protein